MPKAKSKSKSPERMGPFAIKDRVLHKQWGKGLIEAFEGDKLIVLFDDSGAGRKMLSFQAVVDNNLLERV